MKTNVPSAFPFPGYFPNFVIAFFNEYSDKFEFTKASDIMMALLIGNILLRIYLLLDERKTRHNTFSIYCYYGISVCYWCTITASSIVSQQ